MTHGWKHWQRGLGALLASLKFRITLGVVAALALGIGMITMLMLQQAERNTLATQQQREVNEAVRAASMLSRRVVELQRALAATSGQLDAGLLAHPQRLTAFMATQPILLSLFANVFFVSPDGRMRLYVEPAGAREPGLDLSDRDYFQRTVAEGRSVVSGPISGRVAREPVIVITQPVWQDGVLLGVVCGALRLASRDMLGDVVESSESDADGLMVVTDAAGRVLAHPDRGRLSQPLADDPRFESAVQAWVAMRQPVEPSGLALSQPGQLMSVAGVAGPDWLVWRAADESRVLAPLRAARRQSLIWAAELLAAMSLVTVLVLVLLLRPLARLELRAQHLFDGRHDLHAGWPQDKGEIGRLARVLRHVGAERAQLEEFNGQVMKKLGSVMSAAPVGIAFTRSQCFELVSAEFCRLLGRSEEELLGQHTRMIYAVAGDYERLGGEVVTAFRAGDAYVGEWLMVRPSGETFWAQLRGRPVDMADTSAGTIWTVNDVTAQVAARQQLEWMATHDALTGLGNRKAFDERRVQLFEARAQRVPAELIVIDLDAFKPVNDAAGHAAGDAMLKRVAQAISDCVRSRDLVVRMGGDEFAVLLEHCDHAAALDVAEKVRHAITSIRLSYEGHVLGVGASLGVASLRADTASAAAWLEEADTACYQAKASGRGAVRAGPASLRHAGLSARPEALTTV